MTVLATTFWDWASESQSNASFQGLGFVVLGLVEARTNPNSPAGTLGVFATTGATRAGRKRDLLLRGLCTANQPGDAEVLVEVEGNAGRNMGGAKKNVLGMKL